MSSNKKIAEFPEVEAKLQKPTKQSAFERQKAEAEAKRRREAAETAAVYEDFVKSFDNEDDGDFGNQGYGGRHASSRGAGPGSLERPSFGGAPYGGGTGKRHFGMPPGAAPKSGPGSLGPVPSSFDKRRQFDTYQSSKSRDVEEGRGRLGFDDREPVARSVSKAFDDSDDEDAVPTTGRAEEKAISKPTLRLANLPPGTSPAFVKTLIPSNLNAENVKIVPSSGSGGTERKSIAAIVTLSKETPATEIDAAVSALQNRYLGYGFFLSLHRHLSSAAIASGLTTAASSTAVAHPFGAKRVELSVGGPAPQQTGYGRGYAPPSSYGPPAGGPVGRGGGVLHVPVKAPRDIKQIRMIHKVIESVLEHGPEFEALLMSRPDVQREEKWSWIWDARSEGGIYYRWRLWEVVTGLRSKAKYVPLFEGSHAWKVPDPLAYEYTTGVDELVSESEYNSSDDDDFDDEPARHGEGGNNEQEDTFLNPIEKAKLAHLLARLPTTLGKLRKGDVARITAFAITHSSRGADEIADMIVSNIELPLAYTSANPNYKPGTKEKVDNGEGEGSRGPSPGADDKNANETLDMSPARLLGLYVVSDILSSSSTSGVRHAWRYRQLFETALRNRRTFEVLGAMADKSGWGRFRAEKWKRSVGLVLNLWEGWCVFPVETHSYFVSSFEDPPLAQKDVGGGSETTKKAPGRWKTVESSAADGSGTSVDKGGFLPVSEREGKDEAETLDGTEAEMMLETGDTDGDATLPRLQYSSGLEELYSDEDLDGEPDEDFLSLVGGWDRDTIMGGTQEKPADTGEAKAVAGFQMTATKPAGPKKRMRAVDMFAGSDSEGEK
ncbi:U2 snRNP-associated SURP motif-containing protein [Podospora conica]|nr:U2 snRNP-associated SURP motif-containing protein [Schizothecium conicum]